MTNRPPHILIGRSEEKAVALQRALETQGMQAVCVQLIDVRPVQHLEKLEIPKQIDIVVITSQNAVFAYGVLQSRVSPHLLAAVGKKTADALVASGFSPHMVGTGDGALSLLEKLAHEQSLLGRQILYPGSNRIGDEFSARAEEFGAQVHLLTVYETVMPEELTASKLLNFDVAVFYSSSAVQHFFNLVTLSQVEGMAAVAIGESTAQTLNRVGVSPVITAATADTDGLLDAIGRLQFETGMEYSHDVSNRTT